MVTKLPPSLQAKMDKVGAAKVASPCSFGHADKPLRSLLPVPPLHHHTPGSVPVLAPLPWVPFFVRKPLAPAVEEALLGCLDPRLDR
jgi:hypothetical protein